LIHGDGDEVGCASFWIRKSIFDKFTAFQALDEGRRFALRIDAITEDSTMFAVLRRLLRRLYWSLDGRQLCWSNTKPLEVFKPGGFDIENMQLRSQYPQTKVGKRFPFGPQLMKEVCPVMDETFYGAFEIHDEGPPWISGGTKLNPFSRCVNEAEQP
jgi:hypothetical protein